MDDSEETPGTAPVPAPQPSPYAGMPPVPEADYTTDGVPTFDYVRDRIEKRSMTADGATELAGLGTDQTVESLDRQLAAREEAAQDKLAALRRSLREE